MLFLCVNNSARSQMAGAYLKKLGGKKYFAESAGLEAGRLNPLAVEVMKEDGIDISQNETNDVFDYFREGRIYEYVITVCDKEASDSCPVFPGMSKKINWSFTDPSSLSGTYEERLLKTRQVRDQIKQAVLSLIDELSS